MKTDILFTGFYGRKNAGDDAFVEVASWGANEYWNKTNNIFLAKNSKLPLVTNPVKGYPIEFKGTYNLQAEYLLNRTRAFIYAGGSTLHSKLVTKNIRLKAINKKNVRDNFKLGAIGVSIGPFKTANDEKAVKSYLKAMDFLAVRDQASFDFANSINNLPYKPINAFDLAALLPKIYNFTDKKNNNISKKVIGISVCRYESLQPGMNDSQEMIRNSMLVELIKRLDKEENIHFKFFVINGDKKIGDLILTKEAITKSRPSSFELCSYNGEVRRTWKEISNCDFMISTRLHGAIFACFANVPFMLNEYHKKCEDFLSTIDYCEEYRLFNSDYNIETTARKILEILTNSKSYIYPTKIIEMKERALLNFTSIKL